MYPGIIHASRAGVKRLWTGSLEGKLHLEPKSFPWGFLSPVRPLGACSVPIRRSERNDTARGSARERVVSGRAPSLAHDECDQPREDGERGGEEAGGVAARFHQQGDERRAEEHPD